MEPTPSIEDFTPQNVRDNVLPRVFLVRSLTSRLLLRLRRAEQLAARARADTSDERIFAWMAALSLTWTLVENTLKLYETLAEQIDTREEGKRRSLDSRFLRDRTGDEQLTFHSRVWMFPMFDVIPDTAFSNLGVDAEQARVLIANMIERSVAYLVVSEASMRSFYRKYKEPMTAYKHGRALFAFEANFKTTGSGEVSGSLTATNAAVTALVSEKPGKGPPTRLVTVVADADLMNDVASVFHLLAVQLPRLHEFFAASAEASLQFLAFLEKSPDARMPTMPFSFLADPYTPEEEALLVAIRTRGLRF